MENKRNAEQGTYNSKTIYCIVNDWVCPYYKNGVCCIGNSIENCDDFGSFFESWQEWEES